MTRTKTPWGKADHVERLSDTITLYETPSHGGFYVKDVSLALIPKAWREYAAKWSGSENWYEEDCAAAAVVITFPWLFSEQQIEEANRIAKAYLPKA